jgi:hypothetical protein
MSMDARSKDACPRCGQHRLALVELPDVELTNVQVANDTLGIPTEVRLQGEPAIECLACGAEWSDLATFRSEEAGAPDPGTSARP